MKQSRTHRWDQGFTLLEMMIAVAIFTVMVAMATSFFSRASHTTVASAACSNMHQNMRHAVDLMTRDLHAAKRVISAHEEYFFGVVIERPGGDEYVYYLAHNDHLYRFTMHGGEMLAENIDHLEVELRSLSGDVVTAATEAYMVRVRLEAEATARGRTYTDDVETLIRLRNKRV
jgi:prepilin-type N-terminal cleavage/methylation domain-containing protein